MAGKSGPSLADFEGKLKQLSQQRAQLEKQLEAAQQELRVVKAENDLATAKGKARADAAGRHMEARAPVEELRAKIMALHPEQAELARLITSLKGGTNYQPPQP